MGQDKAVAYTTKATFGFDAKPGFILEELECHGRENNIADCAFKKRTHFDPSLTRLDVAGVICSKKGQVESNHYFLIHGKHSGEGNILILDDKGHLGPTCDSQWDLKAVRP